MKSRLGVFLTTAAALGSAAFLIGSAAAQQQVPAPAPQPAASDARPAPSAGPGHRDFGGGGARRNGGGAMARFSPQDRTAFFDAHIAAVKAGLELTPDQEKLWAPLEQAVRDAAKQRADMRQKLTQEGRPTDPVERLQRTADAATARGDTLHKIADAARPLWASLNDDQKHRLPMLMHGMRGGHHMQARNETHQRNGRGGHSRGMMQRPGQGGWNNRQRG